MDVLVGKLVRLRAIRESDFDYFASLRNDMRTQAWGQRLPPCFDVKKVRERAEEILKRPNTGLFAIETVDGELVGQINYEEGPPRFSATIGIIVGMEYWGKGHAHEAQELLLRFLFEERGLQVVRLWTTSWNQRAVKAARKLGFQVAARMRESVVLGGKVCDGIVMDMLREEYYRQRELEDGLVPSLG